jgi:hypothetical protein
LVRFGEKINNNNDDDDDVVRVSFIVESKSFMLFSSLPTKPAPDICSVVIYGRDSKHNGSVGVILTPILPFASPPPPTPDVVVDPTAGSEYVELLTPGSDDCFTNIFRSEHPGLL